MSVKHTYICNLCGVEIVKGSSVVPIYGLEFAPGEGRKLRRAREEDVHRHLCRPCIDGVVEIFRGLPKLSDDHK